MLLCYVVLESLGFQCLQLSEAGLGSREQNRATSLCTDRRCTSAASGLRQNPKP